MLGQGKLNLANKHYQHQQIKATNIRKVWQLISQIWGVKYLQGHNKGITNVKGGVSKCK